MVSYCTLHNNRDTQKQCNSGQSTASSPCVLASDTSEPFSDECCQLTDSVHTWTLMPPCHAHILHAFPSACRVTLFLNTVADNDNWSPQSPKSPSKKRSRAGRKDYPKGSPQAEARAKPEAKARAKTNLARARTGQAKAKTLTSYPDRRMLRSDPLLTSSERLSQTHTCSSADPVSPKQPWRRYATVALMTSAGQWRCRTCIGLAA